jgi:hypothetical protein
LRARPRISASRYTYQAALACLSDAIHAQLFTKVWGDGGTSSSDGQFFRAGGHGEARADHNAKYGSEPGVKFYTHVSDRYAPFHSKVIAANASEAAHVLDGLMHHESSIDIREHYTDTAGAIDHVFGLCHLLGFYFAPRIRDLADRRLHIVGARSKCEPLSWMGACTPVRCASLPDRPQVCSTPVANLAHPRGATRPLRTPQARIAVTMPVAGLAAVELDVDAPTERLIVQVAQDVASFHQPTESGERLGDAVGGAAGSQPLQHDVGRRGARFQRSRDADELIPLRRQARS